MDDNALMLKCIGERHMLRYTIARLYWRENKSAGVIATELGMSRNSVKSILNRLSKK